MNKFFVMSIFIFNMTAHYIHSMDNMDLNNFINHLNENKYYEKKRELIPLLYLIGAIQTGDIELKSGVISPIYFDMRRVISHPEALKLLADIINIRIENSCFDILCGVPYGAVPLATAVALAGNYQMIMPRKDGAKSYGMQNAIEGIFKPGNNCLVIEDVATTGGSILETIKVLEKEGLNIARVIVVVDREQGGLFAVQKQNHCISAIFTLSEIVNELLERNIITHELYTKINEFCAQHKPNTQTNA